MLNGLGIAILSTSKGVMTDREARKQKVGGELSARSGEGAPMSRVGKMPVKIPEKVKVSVDGNP